MYASFSGRAIATDGKAHAISMVSDTGVEVIIYVGMDTVELNGKYYEALGVTIERVKLIDAVPIGINVRSTIATYANIHDEPREIYARTPGSLEG